MSTEAKTIAMSLMLSETHVRAGAERQDGGLNPATNPRIPPVTSCRLAFHHLRRPISISLRCGMSSLCRASL